MEDLEKVWQQQRLTRVARGDARQTAHAGMGRRAASENGGRGSRQTKKAGSAANGGRARGPPRPQRAYARDSGVGAVIPSGMYSSPLWPLQTASCCRAASVAGVGFSAEAGEPASAWRPRGTFSANQ